MEFKFNTFLNVLLHIHIITMVIRCCVSSTEMQKKQKKKIISFCLQLPVSDAED